MVAAPEVIEGDIVVRSGLPHLFGMVGNGRTALLFDAMLEDEVNSM